MKPLPARALARTVATLIGGFCDVRSGTSSKDARPWDDNDNDANDHDDDDDDGDNDDNDEDARLPCRSSSSLYVTFTVVVSEHAGIFGPAVQWRIGLRYHRFSPGSPPQIY